MERALADLIVLFRLLSYAPQGVSLAEAAGLLGLNDESLSILRAQAQSLELPLGFDDKAQRFYLTAPLDLLDEQKIYAQTRGRGRVSVLKVTDSTNDQLLAKLKNTVSGDALLAEVQTKGRGRRGNTWQNRLGEDLMLSMVFDLGSLKEPLGLSMVAGVAVYKALAKFGLKGISLKWPNDLYFADGKLCGMLVETKSLLRREHEETLCAVFGIGLNVHGSGAQRSKVLGRKVAVLDDFAGQPLERSLLAAALINELKLAFAAFKEYGLEPFAKCFNEADYLKGRRICVQSGEHTYRGIAAGVDGSGCLLLTQARQTLHLAAGFNIQLEDK